MSEGMIVKCPQCGATNRISADKWHEKGAVCGKCTHPLDLHKLFPDQAVAASDTTFRDEVLDFPGAVLVEFFATWCGHCRRMAPVVAELASEYAGRVKVVLTDIDKNQMGVSHYKVSGTPTFLLFNKGRLIKRLVGAQPKGELARHVENLK
jgi:thioredoxin